MYNLFICNQWRLFFIKADENTHRLKSKLKIKQRDFK